MRFKSTTFFVFVIFLIAGCIQPPDYPIEPVIEYQSLSKTTLLSGKDGEDQTYLVVSFTDGDGDLGQPQGNGSIELDFTLIDSRTGAVDEKFGIPFVPELGAANGISGEITARIFTSCCIYPDWVTDAIGCEKSNQYLIDTLVYEVYITDRAGNESNHIFTDPIYILCDQ